MEDIDAGRLEDVQHGLQLFRGVDHAGVEVDLLPLGEAEADHELRARRGPDRRHDLGGETHAVLDVVAAVAVLATVGFGPEELIEQIAVGGMHLHAIDTDLLGHEGAAHEGLLDVVQFFEGRRAAVGAGAVGQARGAEGRVGGVGALAALLADGALVPQLHQHRPAGGPHLGHDTGPGVLGGGGDAGEEGDLGRGRMIHRAGFGDHQAHAALDAAAIVLPELGQWRAVLAPLALHAGQHETVGQGKGPELKGREEGRQIESHSRIKAPAAAPVEPGPLHLPASLSPLNLSP